MSTENNSALVTAEAAKNDRAPVTMGNRGVQLNDLAGLYRFSQYVAASPFAPKGMETPETILVALQMGFELGLSPMSALQNVAVINGRPGIYGDAALALVRNSGICLHYSEAETNKDTDGIFREMQFAIIEGDTDAIKQLQKQFALAQSKHDKDAPDFGVTTATLRAGGSLEFGRFTVADAKKAGLWGKSGPWTQYPPRMLKFRSRGFILRDVFGDVLKGFKTTEELEDTSTVKPAQVKEIKSAVIPETKAPALTDAAQPADGLASDGADLQEEPGFTSTPAVEPAQAKEVKAAPAEKKGGKTLGKKPPAVAEIDERPNWSEIKRRLAAKNWTEQNFDTALSTFNITERDEETFKAVIDNWTDVGLEIEKQLEILRRLKEGGWTEEQFESVMATDVIPETDDGKFGDALKNWETVAEELKKL